jgi:hypothetical protein
VWIDSENKKIEKVGILYSSIDRLQHTDSSDLPVLIRLKLAVGLASLEKPSVSPLELPVVSEKAINLRTNKHQYCM